MPDPGHRLLSIYLCFLKDFKRPLQSSQSLSPTAALKDIPKKVVTLLIPEGDSTEG